MYKPKMLIHEQNLFFWQVVKLYYVRENQWQDKRPILQYYPSICLEGMRKMIMVASLQANIWIQVPPRYEGRANHSAAMFNPYEMGSN